MHGREHIFFHAATGVAPYDAVLWSARPEVVVLDSPGRAVAAVRHLGSDTIGTVIADSALEDDQWDALLVNRGGSGMLEWRYCGSLIRVPIHREQVALIPHGGDSRFEFPADTAAMALYFPRGELQRLAAVDPATELPPILGDRRADIADLVVRLERELLAPGFAAGVVSEALLRQIATLVAREDHHEDFAAARIHMTPARLRRVADFVHTHIDAPIGIEDMARVAELSPFHFSRVFKRTTGESPYQYLRRQRLTIARQLLARDQCSLADVALMCGFANQSHFTAAFKRETGLSPGKYRQRLWGVPLG